MIPGGTFDLPAIPLREPAVSFLALWSLFEHCPDRVVARRPPRFMVFETEPSYPNFHFGFFYFGLPVRCASRWWRT